MIAVTYQIRLEEPAIFSALEGDPNEAVSHPYIPGSSIRGLLIGRYMRRHGRDFELDAAHADAQALFFSPQTRYLNAYPAIEGKRSLPIPATWTTFKYPTPEEGNTRSTYAITDSALTNDRNGTPKRKTKSLSGFTITQGDMADTFKPETVINVHNARARRDPAEQQVFRYEALAAEQTFMGAILCANKPDADYVLDLLSEDNNMVLGGSRHAGYGHAILEVAQYDDAWYEVDHQLGDSNLILTFLSDTILRDDAGAAVPTPNSVRNALEDIGIFCDAVEPVSLKTTWVGGFNRKWGLPLPQTLAIGRGSVVCLRRIQADEKSWANLIQHGLGERREDGFGRVALGWQRHEKLTGSKYKPEPLVRDVELSDESNLIWNALRQRIRDQRLEDRIMGIIYDRKYDIVGGINRTQLSRLRSVIANELRQDNPDTGVLASFLTQISGKSAGRQFDQARIGNQALSDWLKNPTFGELNKSITDKSYYVLQLVDAVLERAYLAREKTTQREAN